MKGACCKRVEYCEDLLYMRIQSIVKCIYLFLKLSDPLQCNAVDRHHWTLSGLNNVTSLDTQKVFLAPSLCGKLSVSGIAYAEDRLNKSKDTGEAKV